MFLIACMYASTYQNTYKSKLKCFESEFIDCNFHEFSHFYSVTFRCVFVCCCFCVHVREAVMVYLLNGIQNEDEPAREAP